MAKANEPQGDPMVRINVILTPEERDAFDQWCRYGGKPRMSMNARLRDLMAADVAGKLAVPRRATPRGPKPSVK